MAVTCQSCDYRYSIFEKLPGNYCDNTQALIRGSTYLRVCIISQFNLSEGGGSDWGNSRSLLKLVSV